MGSLALLSGAVGSCSHRRRGHRPAHLTRRPVWLLSTFSAGKPSRWPILGGHSTTNGDISRRARTLHTCREADATRIGTHHRGCDSRVAHDVVPRRAARSLTSDVAALDVAQLA